MNGSTCNMERDDDDGGGPEMSESQAIEVRLAENQEDEEDNMDSTGDSKTYASLNPVDLTLEYVLPPDDDGARGDLEQQQFSNPGEFVLVLDQSIDGTTSDGVTFSLKPLVLLQATTTTTTTESSRKSRMKRKGMNTNTDLWQANKAAKMSSSSQNDELRLQCEWGECEEIFAEMKTFMKHVEGHVEEVEIRFAKRDEEDEDEEEEEEEDCFSCLWHQCGFESASSKDMVRHIHFHSFHTKIKFHGDRVVSETNVSPCQLDGSQRNIVPDMSEPFRCLWGDCKGGGMNDDEEEEPKEFPQAQMFYWHVEWHAEELRGLGLKEMSCQWSDCKSVVLSVNKMKDHLRSHSQERRVGCPVCGALFSNRSKFHDHCTRQLTTLTNVLKCDYCHKSYANERLLRDHMRAHINHYKCPYCDMTCPTPSGINTHIAYKHAEERPFPCELCGFGAKRELDLARHHATVHMEQNHECTIDKCDFSCGSRAELKRHLADCHERSAAAAVVVLEKRYCCHLCPKRFARGHYLTVHLRKSHNFHWPSGHTRFRFRQDEEGLFHVLTVRFESAELNEEDPAAFAPPPTTQ